MAKRRGLGARIFGGALAGAAGPLQDYLASRQHDAETTKQDRLLRERGAESSAREEDQATLKEFRSSVMKGEMDPGQATTAATLQGLKVPAGYFDAIQPPVEKDVAGVLKGIDTAKRYEDLPTEVGLNASMPRRIAPLHLSDTPLKFLDTSTEFPPFDQGDPNAQRIAEGLHAKRRALTQGAPITEREGFVTSGKDAGALTTTARRFNPMSQSFEDLGTTQKGPGAKQAGALAGQKSIEEMLAGLEGGLPEMTGASANRTELVKRPVAIESDVKKQDALWPGQQREINYREGVRKAGEANTPTMSTGHDADGNEIPLMIDKRIGKATPVELPEGFKGGKPARLTAAQTSQQTDLNVAETTGVKLLEQLRAQGLDKDNDPGSPRLQKFLVNTLKIAPQDAAKAGVQWDAAFINATLSRTLMGGRPSQYIAEMMQPHLPQQAMSGQQLANVMERVLTTVDGKRKELAQVSKVPLTQLQPASGKSWSQYRIEREGVPAPSGVKPTVTFDANGNVVPIPAR